jgi:hypothetical protein
VANLRVHADNRIWQVKVRERTSRWAKPEDRGVVRNFLYTRRRDAVNRALDALEVIDFKVGYVDWQKDEAFFEEHGSQILLNKLPEVNDVG